jgi:hypothetical protein
MLGNQVGYVRIPCSKRSITEVDSATSQDRARVTGNSLENPLLQLDSVFGGRKVYGCDCDLVAELAKRSHQHPGAFFLGLGIRFAALLDKSHPSCKIFQTTRQSRCAIAQTAD